MKIIKRNPKIQERHFPDISDAILNHLEFGADYLDISNFHELTGLDITEIVKG
ncbi:MAG: hypothetical protein KC646_17985 [Candidatus Cloacimonetes bacterium]|nr:hypothetical protein [Candidatus Cloacimonadota bacterium]MCO4784220.1 hypothetical protein [Candidatus Cloacimonadota bacterium]